MEKFGRFEIENSISEIGRQGKIEIKMLRTSLTMSAGASSFRASFFSEQAHHLQTFLSHPSMVPSRLPHGRSFGHTRPRSCADGRSISNNGRINLQSDRFRAVFWSLESMAAD